jgi:hypothetical protein
MFRIAKLALSLAVVAALGACASSATRIPSSSASAQPVTIEKSAKSVSIWLNDDAKKLVADNVKFNPDTLRSTVERSLQSQGMIQAASPQLVDIEVTSFRVRSAFSAVMFGFMAGNDNIEGIVTIKGLDGSVLQRSKVTASYALGGLAGGQDESRMSWLYEEFAKQTLAELTGVPAK